MSIFDDLAYLIEESSSSLFLSPLPVGEPTLEELDLGEEEEEEEYEEPKDHDIINQGDDYYYCLTVAHRMYYFGPYRTAFECENKHDFMAWRCGYPMDKLFRPLHMRHFLGYISIRYMAERKACLVERGEFDEKMEESEILFYNRVKIVNRRLFDYKNISLENTRPGKKINGLQNKVSRFRGVSYELATSKWVARLYKRRDLIYIGRFKSEEEAAQNYNTIAHQYGLYDKMNMFIPNTTTPIPMTMSSRIRNDKSIAPPKKKKSSVRFLV